LVGEASFHQFHGGVSTNIERKEHPIKMFKEEYQQIKGCAYMKPSYQPYYWGTLPKEVANSIPLSTHGEILSLAKKMVLNGKANSAIEMLLEMPSFQQQHPAFYHTLGFCYQKSQRLNEAAQAYRKGMALQPDGNVSFPLIDILIKKGKLHHALNLINIGLKNKYDNPSLLFKKIIVLKKSKKPEEFNLVLDNLLHMLKGRSLFSKGVYVQVARFCLNNRRKNDALETIEIGTGKYPKDTDLLMLKARILLSLKKYKESEKVLTEILPKIKADQRGPIYAIYGYLFKAQSQNNKALDYFEKSLALSFDIHTIQKQILQLKTNG